MFVFLLPSGLDCTLERGEIVPSLRMYKKFTEVRDKREGGREKKTPRVNRNCRKCWEKQGTELLFKSQKRRKENAVLGLGRGLCIIFCKPAELLDWDCTRRSRLAILQQHEGGDVHVHLFYFVSLWMFYKALFWRKIWSLGFKTFLGVLLVLS